MSRIDRSPAIDVPRGQRNISSAGYAECVGADSNRIGLLAPCAAYAASMLDALVHVNTRLEAERRRCASRLHRIACGSGIAGIDEHTRSGERFGQAACSSSRRFAARSWTKRVNASTLPPGRALVDESRASPGRRRPNTTGMVCGRCFDAPVRGGSPGATITRDPTAH